MAALVAWMQTLFLTVMVAALADLLLPPSGLKKTARWALGMAVLAVLLRPLTGALPLAPQAWAAPLWPSPPEMPLSQEDATQKSFQTLLEKRMALEVENLPGVARARVAVALGEGPYPWGDVAGVKVEVAVQGKASEGMAQAVGEHLAKAFGIPPGRVEVEVVDAHGP